MSATPGRPEGGSYAAVSARRPIPEVAPAVLDALRRGRHGEIVDLLAPYGAEERASLRTTIRSSATAILAAPGLANDPEHRWAGRLSANHTIAATTALIATATLAQALRQHTLDEPVPHRYLPRLFPNDLAAFVDAFSDRYLRNPKAWDRNRGIEGMFDWLKEGLIEPPTQQGAVLALICWGLRGTRNQRWSYLLERPGLIQVTLPRLFAVPGIKGASGAQHDDTSSSARLDDWLIPRLIREGHWGRQEVLAWCDTALDVPRTEYEYRWFRALKNRVGRMRG